MTMECPTCLRPLPEVSKGVPRTDAEATMLTLLAGGASTAREVALALVGRAVSQGQIDRVRQRLDGMAGDGLVDRLQGRRGAGGTAPTRYRVSTAEPWPAEWRAAAGREVDALELLAVTGVQTAASLASAVFATEHPTRAQIERARRQLDQLVEHGLARIGEPGPRSGAVRYHPRMVAAG